MATHSGIFAWKLLYTQGQAGRKTERILSSAASNPRVLDPRFPHLKHAGVSMCQSLSRDFSRWSQGASSRGMSPPESPLSRTVEKCSKEEHIFSECCLVTVRNYQHNG